MYPARRQISRHAGELRRSATKVEKRLWLALRNRQLDGSKFRRQAPLGPFVVDFLCIEARLVVELVGGQHSTQRDAQRTAWPECAGYEMLRFWNNEVIENFDGIVGAIANALARKKKTLTQPSPAKAGEGWEAITAFHQSAEMTCWCGDRFRIQVPQSLDEAREGPGDHSPGPFYWLGLRPTWEQVPCRRTGSAAWPPTRRPALGESTPSQG